MTCSWCTDFLHLARAAGHGHHVLQVVQRAGRRGSNSKGLGVRGGSQAATRQQGALACWSSFRPFCLLPGWSIQPHSDSLSALLGTSSLNRPMSHRRPPCGLSAVAGGTAAPPEGVMWVHSASETFQVKGGNPSSRWHGHARETTS